MDALYAFLFIMHEVTLILYPARFHFMGSEPSIFRVATVDRLVKWTMHRNKFLNEDYVRQSAEIALGTFYAEYQHRFVDIGHPHEHMLPLIINGFRQDDDNGVRRKRRPLPKAKWTRLDVK